MRYLKATSRGALCILAGMALTSLTACGTLGIGGGSEDRGAQLEVRVTNNLASFERVSVSLQNIEGQRHSLGDVDAGDTKSFEATADPGEDVRYRLMAEPNRGGETILSREIVIRQSSIVSWNLRDNQVEVHEARDRPTN